MVALTGVLPALATPAPSPAPGSSTGSSTSFSQQLATAIEQVLHNTKPGSRIEIDVNSAPTPAPGADGQAPGQQFTLLVKDTTEAPISPWEYAAALAGNWSPSATPSEGIPANDPNAPPAHAPKPTDKSKMTEADSYWTQQPEAVQGLRDLPDVESRTALASKLRAQGFTVDYPIMVQGWIR